MSDVAINPKSLVVDGAIVSNTNPLPVVSAAAASPGTDVALSPTCWVVNGALVSATNPLPVTLG